MQIAVRGKNIEITNALREHVEKKVGKMEKYFEYPISAQVTLNVERDRHIVEVTIPINGMLLRGEEETGDMYASVDLVLEKLEKQVDRFKARINRKLRQNETKIPHLGAGINEPADEEDDELKVVKTKRFSLKPMGIEEAVLQMNLIGHDFYVFTNAETEQVNVVYRRKDGKYGLIEPEI